MSYDYGMYAGWTAQDLLSGKPNAPSPFPDGAVPADWDWQNFLNYGGDGQARALIESGVLKKPEPEKPQAAPIKKAKAKLKSWAERPPKAAKPKAKKSAAKKAKKR